MRNIYAWNLLDNFCNLFKLSTFSLRICKQYPLTCWYHLVYVLLAFILFGFQAFGLCVYPMKTNSETRRSQLNSYVFISKLQTTSHWLSLLLPYYVWVWSVKNHFSYWLFETIVYSCPNHKLKFLKCMIMLALESLKLNCEAASHILYFATRSRHLYIYKNGKFLFKKNLPLV